MYDLSQDWRALKRLGFVEKLPVGSMLLRHRYFQLENDVDHLWD